MASSSRLHPIDDRASVAAGSRSDEHIYATFGKAGTSSDSRVCAPDPIAFIKRLATQNQILACIDWLSEFHILPCIPQCGSVSFAEITDLKNVSMTQLSHVVRMVTTAGFLHEPRPGHIAHTPLSAAFVTNLTLLDATTFLARIASPSALHMAAAAHTPADRQRSSAYTVAFPDSPPFSTLCTEKPKIERQWSAYCRCIGSIDDGMPELLGLLKWNSLGSACIVDVCAQSTQIATALAQAYPSLRFIVQMSDGMHASASFGSLEGYGGQIVVQKRAPTEPQAIKNAAVYILHITDPLKARIQPLRAELAAHLEVLRQSPSATLVLALPVLPEPGSVSSDVEAGARLRDLCRFQLTGKHDLELNMLLDMVSSVGDARGRLAVVNKRIGSQGAMAALGVKYRADTDKPGTDEQVSVKKWHNSGRIRAGYDSGTA